MADDRRITRKHNIEWTCTNCGTVHLLTKKMHREQIKDSQAFCCSQCPKNYHFVLSVNYFPTIGMH